MDRSGQSDFFEVLATVLVVLSKGKMILLVALLAGAAIGASIAAFSEPTYRSSVLVALSQESSSGSRISPELAGVASLVGVGISNKDSGEEAVAVLSSRRLTYLFLDSHDLLPELFADRWSIAEGSWKSNSDIPSRYEAFEYFREDVRKVNQDARTGLITLSIDWREPQLAADWANNLIAMANELNKKVAIQDATKQLEYIRQQLNKTDEAHARTVLFRIMEDQMTRIAVASTRDEFAFRVIDPAVAADESHPIKPKVALLVLTSAFLGLFAGMFLLVVLLIREKMRLITS